MSAPGKLTSNEYESRKRWLENLSNLTKAEYVEIVRILKKEGDQYSENNNGIFFNVATVKQETFDALQLFMEFTFKNRSELADREKFLSTLVVTVAP